VEVTLQSKLGASDKVMSLSQRAAIASTAVLLLTIVHHSYALCASPPLGGHYVIFPALLLALILLAAYFGLREAVAAPAPESSPAAYFSDSRWSVRSPGSGYSRVAIITR
jgi:hypothetical protein